MADFEDFEATAARIVREIEGKLVVLGIRSDDLGAIRTLAHAALTYHHTDSHTISETQRTLYGLIALMFQTMAEGAQSGLHVHGSETWKTLARALWAEKNALGQ